MSTEESVRPGTLLSLLLVSQFAMLAVAAPNGKLCTPHAARRVMSKQVLEFPIAMR